MPELLERAKPLAVLATAWQRARKDGGAVALVGGEAGIGKTALVRELVKTVSATARTLIGACDPLSTPGPLGPLHDLLRELPAVGRALATSRSVSEVFALVREELGRPTLFVIEDAHWADTTTIDLLRFLARRIDGARSLVVVTFRDEEVGPQHPLRVAIGDMASSRVVRVALEPLSESAVRTLAAGTKLDARDVHRRTGGNPFFVTEVVAEPDAAIPANVRDAVLARAARLSPAARITLEIAATIGPTAKLALVRDVAASESLDIDACVALGILSAGAGQVAFCHELARQAVLSAVPAGRSLHWHARVLAVLRGTGAEVATLAHHAVVAGDGPAVVEFGTAAAKEAVALGSHREAAAQFARALEHTPANAAARADLLEPYAYESYLISRLDDAIRACAEAVAIRTKLGDRIRQGNALRWLSRYHWFAGNNAEAKKFAQRAIATLETQPAGVELAWAYSNASQLATLSDDARATERWARQAIRAARRIGDVEIEIHARNNLGSMRAKTGDAHGWADLQWSLARARDAGFEDHAGRGYAGLVSWGLTARHAAADRWLDEGLAYTAEHELDNYYKYLVGWRAFSHFQHGRFVDAERDAREVLAMPSLTPVQRVMPLAVLGRALAHRRDSEAWRAFDEGLVIAERIGELQRVGPIRIARAEAAWLGGDDARACAEAEAALPLAIAGKNPWVAGELLYWLWRGGGKPKLPAWCATAFRDTIRRRPTAVRTWRRLRCPIEATLATADRGTEADLRAAFEELEALGAMAAGERVAYRLRDLGVARVPRGRRASTRSHPAGLTRRESEVLVLLSEGLRNAEIARRLFISAKTVDHHVSAILAKLGVTTRAQAARWRTPSSGTGS